MRSIVVALLFGATLLTPVFCIAEEKKNQGPPPMLVEVATITEGSAAPMIELVGSVEYARTSRVAAEIGGLVETVDFKEGEKVKAGQPLLKLRSDLLETSLNATRANYEQSQVELEKAGKDLDRVAGLYQKNAVAESLYDENYFRVRALEKRSQSLKALLQRQQLELQKTTIKAPFSGLVQSKLIEKGEWVASGGQVAIVADNRNLEAHIDVPQRLLTYLEQGKQIAVTCGGKEYRADFIHIIPRGDIATRTFTVKLKLLEAAGLLAGMEASAQLPNGPTINGLLVPRDAVIKAFGNDVIYLAEGNTAKMMPVRINGYRGMQVAISAPGISAGAQVVVKGNERIHDGQAIRF